MVPPEMKNSRAEAEIALSLSKRQRSREPNAGIIGSKSNPINLLEEFEEDVRGGVFTTWCKILSPGDTLRGTFSLSRNEEGGFRVQVQQSKEDEDDSSESDYEEDGEVESARE